MKSFEIDPAHLCSVIVQKEYNLYSGKKQLTEEETVNVLLGKNRIFSTHYEDHPSFASLRKQLGNEGLISVVTNYWNGDVVLKPFYLNGALFKKGDRFPCASAIKYNIDSKRNQGKTRLTTIEKNNKIEFDQE